MAHPLDNLRNSPEFLEGVSGAYDAAFNPPAPAKTHSVLSLTKAELGRLRFVLGEFGGLCEEVSIGIDAVEQASDDALLARIDKAIASFGP